MPEESKPWYKSKGILGSLIVLAAFILNAVGQQQTAEKVTEQASGITDWLVSLGTLIGAGLALYGRLKATQPIG